MERSPQIECDKRHRESEPENRVTICRTVGREVMPHRCQGGRGNRFEHFQNHADQQVRDKMHVRFEQMTNCKLFLSPWLTFAL